RVEFHGGQGVGVGRGGGGGGNFAAVGNFIQMRAVDGLALAAGGGRWCRCGCGGRSWIGHFFILVEGWGGKWRVLTHFSVFHRKLLKIMYLMPAFWLERSKVKPSGSKVSVSRSNIKPSS